MWIGFVNRIAYGFSRKLGLLVNRRIVTLHAGRIFSLFATYMNFRVSADKSLFDRLPDQYLIIANHQSLLDIPLLMRYLGGIRLRFVAKAELGTNVPVVSQVLRSDKHCLVSRKGSASSAMRAMDRFAGRVLQNNWIPVLFPEGTRSVDGSLGEFYAAGFRRLQDKLALPVAVIAIDGGWRISSLSHLGRAARGSFYRVKLLGIFPKPTTKDEQVALLQRGKELIGEQLALWRREDEKLPGHS